LTIHDYQKVNNLGSN